MRQKLLKIMDLITFWDLVYCELARCMKAMEEEFALEFEAFEKFYSSSEADCPPYPLQTDSSSRLHGTTRSSSAI